MIPFYMRYFNDIFESNIDVILPVPHRKIWQYFKCYKKSLFWGVI